MDSFPSALPTSLTSLLSTPSAVASPQASALTPSVTASNTSQSSSWLGLFGSVLLAMARGIPGILIWIITFTTITLPTVLFALFSTSLTFTMNFTTLYVYVTRRQESRNKLIGFEDAHRLGLRVPRLMDCEIPVSEHVRATASRASAKRAPDRSLSRHTRWRLEAGSRKLSG